MKNEKMLGLLINVKDNEIHEIEIDENNVLKDIKEAIGCDLVDVVADINVGGRRYDIIVDDEGLLKEDRKPAARCMDAEQILFGNIVLLNHDYDNQEWKSLSKSDVSNINEHIYGIRDRITDEVSPLLEYKYGDDLAS
jgi:hypothetical protein